MPAIKGGSFDRATHKSKIEDMIDRAAAAPGPGEVQPSSLPLDSRFHTGIASPFSIMLLRTFALFVSVT